MKSGGWEFVVSFLFCLVLVARATPTLHCLNDSLHGTGEPWPKLSIPLNYRVVVRFTDLVQNTTAKITETNFTHELVVSKEQAGVVETFISHANNSIRFQGDNCSTVNSTDWQRVYGLSAELRSFFGNPASSLSEILAGVINAGYDGSHAIGTAWVDGVDTASWLGCANQTDKRPGIEVDVQFLGDTQESLKPYSNVSRPLVASIRLITYEIDAKTNGTKILSHVWLNLVEVEQAKVEDQFDALQIPRGVFCSGMPAVQLPSGLPLKFEANLEYVEVGRNTTDSVELMYDGENKIVSFALDFDADTDIPFVQSEVDMKLGKARVYQDFTTGFEYVLSKEGRVCRQTLPINSSWDDVQTVDGKLNLRDPTDVFFNVTHEVAYFGGKIREGGALFDLYVTRKISSNTKDYIVVELLFVADGWRVDDNEPRGVHSIVQYHKNENHELVRTTITRFNSFTNNTLVGTSWSRHTVFTCLHEGKVENFFYLKIADHTLEQLQEFGYENVESALVEAVAKTANISVLRISQFLLKQTATELYACFLLAEETTGTPAPTRYLRPQKTVAEVRKIINDTLLDHRIVVSVVTEKSKTVTVAVHSLGILTADDSHPPTPPHYTGYSSGSMFILGVFTFIFGAGTAVGGYVFYTRRQSIRGIAYQVFE